VLACAGSLANCQGAIAAVYSLARAVIRATADSPSCNSQPREPSSAA